MGSNYRLGGYINYGGNLQATEAENRFLSNSLVR